MNFSKLKQEVAKKGINKTDEQIHQALAELGYTDSLPDDLVKPFIEDLAKSSSLAVAGGKSADTLTVTTARETDPDNLTGGIVPSQPTGLGAQVPRSEPIQINPIEYMSVSYAGASHGQTLSLEAQLAAHQHLLSRLDGIDASMIALSQIEIKAQEYEYTRMLQLFGQDSSGDLKTKVKRWMDFLAGRQARNQQIEAELSQLLAVADARFTGVGMSGMSR